MGRLDRKKIASRLQYLAAQGGGILEIDRMIEDARDPENPMHTHFTWDDTKAAHERRRDQARKLIQSVRFRYEVEERTYEAPMFVHNVDDNRKSGYVETVTLLSDEEKAYDSLKMEFERVRGAMRRARTVAAVLSLEDELDGLLASIDVFLAKAATLKAA